ncbi:hypothetical protein SAMD00019534_076630 [Acytostelium subglobosum LB1]|uniref:hypothetical protein n=1 Tax=Acytostelium subglobosum LB1 TaxID=1410327 RepID=UPI00064495F1|nr:hypothetical protein SAMD00019534_076630 [Acytostelium subglobosum LB1]GAM24488.1 hypothetical protein SAMD00019534_076630 [Acytostelium subglobosum LB1]|eukprot:XP_012752814.1 hypothetical protein SAMD00019534_076630 [Acytostelium subglobosum LB1]
MNLMDRTSSTIYVSNIRHTTPVSSISMIFSKFGPLERCEIPENKFGKTRGFAFIEFENKSHAYTAMDELSKQDIILDGRVLKLEWARATKLYKEDIQSLSNESKEKIMGNFSRVHQFDSKYSKTKQPRKGVATMTNPIPSTTTMTTISNTAAVPKRTMTTNGYNGASLNGYDSSQMVGIKPKPFGSQHTLIKDPMDYPNGGTVNPSAFGIPPHHHHLHQHPGQLASLNNAFAKKNVNLIVNGQPFENKLMVNGNGQPMMVPTSAPHSSSSSNYIGSGNLNNSSTNSPAASSSSTVISGAGVVGMKNYTELPPHGSLINSSSSSSISSTGSNSSVNSNSSSTSLSPNNSAASGAAAAASTNTTIHSNSSSTNSSPNSSNNTTSVHDNDNANSIFTSYFGSNGNNNFDFNLQTTLSSIASLDFRANEVSLTKPYNLHSTATNFPAAPTTSTTNSSLSSSTPAAPTAATSNNIPIPAPTSTNNNNNNTNNHNHNNNHHHNNNIGSTYNNVEHGAHFNNNNHHHHYQQSNPMSYRMSQDPVYVNNPPNNFNNYNNYSNVNLPSNYGGFTYFNSSF